MTATTTLTLNLDNLRESLAPLYKQYPGQYRPQPADLILTEDGEVCADWDGNIGGGTSMHVAHNRTLEWSVNPSVNGPVLAALIEGELLPLLERVHAGHSVDWDGSNHRGTLTADAQEASEEIQKTLDRLQDDESAMAQVWDADEWVNSGTFADVWPEGVTLEKAVADTEAFAAGESVITGDLEKALLDAAESLFDRKSDRLKPSHAAELLAAGRITQAQHDEWLAARAEE